jgi:FlaA1/EpsC-like NDP-sugar epimerase
VVYRITSEGINQKKVLNIGYLKHVQLLYQAGKEYIERFIDTLVKNSYKRLYIYGAGEVSVILLSVLQKRYDEIIVVGIIDDDSKSIKFFGHKVISRNQVEEQDYDGILIASYTHHDRMREKLLQDGIPISKIVEFF